MRSIILFGLLLSACSKQPAEPSLATGTFAGKGPDRLCIEGEPDAYRGGLIAYGESNSNCSASGRIEGSGNQLTLVPRGEGPCRIPLTIEGNTVRVGQVPAACGYYCGPGASLADKSFNRTDMGTKAVDLAGDPLC